MHTELLEKCLSEDHCEKCYSISFVAPGQVYWYNTQAFFSPTEQLQLSLLFLCVRHFSAYIIFMFIHWTCSVFMSSLSCGAQNWTQPRDGSPSAQQRQSLPFLDPSLLQWCIAASWLACPSGRPGPLQCCFQSVGWRYHYSHSNWNRSQGESYRKLFLSLLYLIFVWKTWLFALIALMGGAKAKDSCNILSDIGIFEIWEAQQLHQLSVSASQFWLVQILSLSPMLLLCTTHTLWAVFPGSLSLCVLRLRRELDSVGCDGFLIRKNQELLSVTPRLVQMIYWQ